MPDLSGPLRTADVVRRQLGNGPVRVADVLAAGVTPSQLRAAVARGSLVSPRHGVVVVPDAAASSTRALHASRRAAHLEAVRGAVVSVGGDAVVTHDSAAIVLDHPRPSTAVPARVTLARAGVPDYDGPGHRVRGSEIPASFVTVVDGLRVTDVRRTAIDLARGRALPDALIPLDAAARRLIAGWTGTSGNALRRAVHRAGLRQRAADELVYALSACRGWPGIASVRRALAHVDPASESPLESRSRGWFQLVGLSGLQVGMPLTVGGTTYWADFLAVDRRLIGEADGWSKYGDGIDDVKRALREEKARHARLESAGYRIVRWTSEDTRAAVVDRMRNALRSDW